MEFLKRLLGWSPRAEAEPAPIGLVVLTDTYVEPTVASLLETLDGLYPGAFLPPREDNFVLDGPARESQFLIQSRVAGASGLFMLQTVAGPYTMFSNFDETIADPGLQALARAAILARVDAISAHGSEADAYRFIGALLAKLAPAEAAAVVRVDNGETIRFDAAVRERLARGDF